MRISIFKQKVNSSARGMYTQEEVISRNFKAINHPRRRDCYDAVLFLLGARVVRRMRPYKAR